LNTKINKAKKKNPS